MLQGHSVLANPEKNFVAEAQGNSCAIKHISTGDYSRTLFKGEHKILVLTLRPDWFISSTQHLELFKPLIENYQNPVRPVFSLPRCPIKTEILNPLKKMLAHDGNNEKDLGNTIHDFSSSVIYDYHQMLNTGRLITAALHQLKAKEIAQFVLRNYADAIVTNASTLASQFNVSERLFADLCKMAFKKPLHKHVIDLRMNYGLLFLITTTRTVSEVAFQVGYNDPRYFSKEFKKYHHISPSEVQGLCM
ncbi:DNA-binding transcriptional regulator AraC [compost metagenome]